MSNVSKVNEFLDKAKVFYFLTTDGNQPKGRPFGFHLLDGDKLYFGCGTFKNVFRQLTANPQVEILAMNGGEFLRYDGVATIVKNGWEMGLFYLENGHAEIRGMLDLKEEFDV